MEGRVEPLAGRIEGLDARAPELLAKLLQHQGDALGERLRIGRGRLERALEVVERGQELAGELGLAARQRVGRFLRDPLAVVLEVGPGALGQLQVLVALALRLTELVEIALDALRGLALVALRLLSSRAAGSRSASVRSGGFRSVIGAP